MEHLINFDPELEKAKFLESSEEILARFANGKSLDEFVNQD